VTHDSAARLDAPASSFAGELRIETGAKPGTAAARRTGAEATSGPVLLLLTPTGVE
jgi:hypothetical protein